MLRPFLTIYYEPKIQLITIAEFSATLALESDCKKHLVISFTLALTLHLKFTFWTLDSLHHTLTARPPSHNQDWSSAGISARGDVRDIRVLEAHTLLLATEPCDLP